MNGKNFDDVDASVYSTDSSEFNEGASGGNQTKHPEYETKEVRIRSFPKDWSDNPNQSSDAMSAAGFFYPVRRHDKKKDEVCCYCCGLLVWAWEPDDLPWKEHVKLNKDCKFAQKIETFQKALCQLKEKGYKQSDIDQVLNIMQPSGAATLKSVVYEALDLLEKRQQGESGTTIGKRTLQCISCKENDSRVLFLPCTCIVACIMCAKVTSECFRCDKNITEKMEVYYS